MAERVIRFVNGIPTTVYVSVGAPTTWERSLLITTEVGVAGTGYDTTHKIITLPEAMTYDGTKDALEVFIGDTASVQGKLSKGTGVVFGVTDSETTVTLIEAAQKDMRIIFRKLS